MSSKKMVRAAGEQQSSLENAAMFSSYVQQQQ
jgi:hypothetical protein